MERKRTKKSIAKRLDDGKIRIQPWRHDGGQYVDCSISECTAVWTYSEFTDYKAVVTTADLHEDGTIEVHDVSDPDLLTKEEAKILAQVLKERHGFSGDYSLSKSRRTWNIWKRSRSNRNKRRKTNSRQHLPQDFDRHLQDDSMIYFDGEWYHEDHF